MCSFNLWHLLLQYFALIFMFFSPIIFLAVPTAIIRLSACRAYLMLPQRILWRPAEAALLWWINLQLINLSLLFLNLLDMLVPRLWSIVQPRVNKGNGLTLDLVLRGFLWRKFIQKVVLLLFAEVVKTCLQIVLDDLYCYLAHLSLLCLALL